MESEGDQIEKAISMYFDHKRKGGDFTPSDPFTYPIKFEHKVKTLCIVPFMWRRGGMSMWYEEDQL